MFLRTQDKKFLDILFDREVVKHKMKIIQSKLHKIGTYDVSKISKSCFDDKRYILNDDINTLAYFHKDIKSKNWIKLIKFIKLIESLKFLGLIWLIKSAKIYWVWTILDIIFIRSIGLIKSNQ